MKRSTSILATLFFPHSVDGGGRQPIPGAGSAEEPVDDIVLWVHWSLPNMQEVIDTRSDLTVSELDASAQAVKTNIDHQRASEAAGKKPGSIQLNL